MEESGSAGSVEAGGDGGSYGEQEAQKTAASKRKRNPPGMPGEELEETWFGDPMRSC